MERLIDRLRDYLQLSQGKVVNLKDLRTYFRIESGSSDDTLLRTHMSTTLVKDRTIRSSGKGDGFYKVVRQVKPVQVFDKSRERRPPFKLILPCDKYGEEMAFAKYIVIREGDLISIGGVKSKGKTALCLLIAAENIDEGPVLMGNEYTVLVKDRYEPAPRFLHRLDRMSEWVEWVNGDGSDKFTLLPVRDDYAEHIVKDKLNIIDWINLDANALYDIGKVLEDIKANLGRGVAIVALQKGEDYTNPRGGQFVRDFSDVEILLDGFGSCEDDILLTLKGVKEKTAPIVGRKYAYTIINGGTQIDNFREVIKCGACYGKKWRKQGNTSIPCDVCDKTGYINKKVDNPL